MFETLKKKLPWAYDYYLHIQRRKKISEIKKLKHKSLQEQKRILEGLYKEKIGHTLDWNNLNTYTEKMQWEKLFNKNPMKAQLSDKYAVREWVASKIGEEYLIPLLGCWDSFDDIDFYNLPNQFVLKTNHGSGTNLIIRDKSEINLKRVKRALKDWIETDYGFNTGFELHYSDIKPKIIAEKYMKTESGELQDYKFLCFGGKPYFCWVDMGRYSKHTRNVYDLNWNLQPWNQSSYGIYSEPIPRPKNFEKMIELANILCQEFSHVRVDFYNIDGVIYFGEMTFTNGSGLDPIIPNQYDRMLGDLWKVDTSKCEC